MKNIKTTLTLMTIALCAVATHEIFAGKDTLSTEGGEREVHIRFLNPHFVPNFAPNHTSKKTDKRE